MKKILVVKITQNIASKQEQINLVSSEISFDPADEWYIKHRIESSRNPQELSAIIIEHMSLEDILEIKNSLDEMLACISDADTIEVSFLPVEACDGLCEGCILHSLHDQLDRIFINDALDISHPCLN